MDKDFNYLFNEVTLYTKEEFKIFKQNDNLFESNKDEIVRFIEYIRPNGKLITQCHKCKKEFPFNVNYDINYFDNGNMFHTDSFKLNNRSRLSITGNIMEGMGIVAKTTASSTNELAHNIYYIVYDCTCTNNNNHNYFMMISIEFYKGVVKVRKIGQNPSMLTLKGYDFDKYKKQLKELNAYEEYKKADISFSQHLYVGAFAYLRRIFEKMVMEYLNGQQLSDEHMDTKITAVKHKFDPTIQPLLKNMYGILSASIHEISEELSKEYYEDLKTIINIQLEFIKTEQDKQELGKELHNNLSRIKSRITQH